MLWVYLVAAAAFIPILDRFFDILQESYSWWLVIVLYLGIFLALVILQCLVLVVSILLVDTKKPAERFSRYFRALVNATLPMIFRLVRVKIEVTGEEKIPRDKRILLVCNHMHEFDPALLMCAFPQAELGFIGKKEIYSKMKFVAKAMHKLHGLPIDRENNREAVKTIVEATKLITNDVCSVGIFPEGYASVTEELLPMRNGAFKIATKAKAPIVVCTLDNTRKILKNLFIRKTVIHIDVLGVLEPQDFAEMTTTDIGDKVYEMMQENIQKRRA